MPDCAKEERSNPGKVKEDEVETEQGTSPAPKGTSKEPAKKRCMLDDVRLGCRDVVVKNNPRAAMFLAIFIHKSRFIVKRLSLSEDISGYLLEAVSHVTKSRSVFKPYLREILLQASVQSAIFSQSQRDQMMRDLPQIWSDVIWSTDHGKLNYPLDAFNTDTPETASEVISSRKHRDSRPEGWKNCTPGFSVREVKEQEYFQPDCFTHEELQDLPAPKCKPTKHQVRFALDEDLTSQLDGGKGLNGNDVEKNSPQKLHYDSLECN